MDCDLDHDGNTTIGQFKEKLEEMDVKLSDALYNFFINMFLEEDFYDPTSDKSFVSQAKKANPNVSDSDIISFKKL